MVRYERDIIESMDRVKFTTLQKHCMGKQSNSLRTMSS